MGLLPLRLLAPRFAATVARPGSTCAPEAGKQSSLWGLPSPRIATSWKQVVPSIVTIMLLLELCSWPQAVPHAELKHPRSPMAAGRSQPMAVAKAANSSKQRFGHYRKCLDRYQNPNLTTLQGTTSKGESNPPYIRIIHRFLNLPLP